MNTNPTHMIIHIIIATFQMPINVLKNLKLRRNSRVLSTKKIGSGKKGYYFMSYSINNTCGLEDIFESLGILQVAVNLLDI